MTALVGKALILLGGILLFVGVLLVMGIRIPSWFGRLPGDFVFERENVRIYLPITTSVLLSLLLSFLWWLIGRR